MSLEKDRIEIKILINGKERINQLISQGFYGKLELTFVNGDLIYDELTKRRKHVST